MRPTFAGLTAFTQGFSSLRNRNYRLFWFGQLVSLAGTWMQDVALSWLVLSVTNSPVALGLTMTIRFAPALLFSLHGGVLADRLRKRQTIIVSETTQLIVALALAVLTSTNLVTVTIIYVLAGVRGFVDAIEGPTRQAFVSEMVGTKDLRNAVALNTTLFNSARIIGPALGAGVISVFGGGMHGIAACFYLNAVSFAAVIGALFAMRKRELHLLPRIPRGDSWRQLREGLRYARNTPSVLVMFIVMGFLGAFGFNFQTILPLVTKYVLHAEASTLALLTTSMGGGSVAAGLVVAYRGRPTQRLLLISAACFTVLLGLVGISRWTVVTAILLFALGFVAVLTMTSVNTRLQLGVPGDLRGRVLGMYILLFIGTTPIGSYLIGVLAKYAHVRPTVLIMAGLSAVGVIAAYLYALRSSSGSWPEELEQE